MAIKKWLLFREGSKCPSIIQMQCRPDRRIQGGDYPPGRTIGHFYSFVWTNRRKLLVEQEQHTYWPGCMVKEFQLNIHRSERDFKVSIILKLEAGLERTFIMDVWRENWATAGLLLRSWNRGMCVAAYNSTVETG